MGKIIGENYYDSKGNPAHRGMVKVDGKLYYAGEGGKLVKDRKKVVHKKMANDLVEHGTYYFDSEGVIDIASLEKPVKKKHRKAKKGKPAKNNRLTIALLIAGFLLIVFLLIYAEFIEPTPRSKAAVTTGKGLKISVEDYDEEVYLCSNAMIHFYNGEIPLTQAIQSDPVPYKPFLFNYTVQNAETAVLLLGEKADFTDGVTIPLDLQKQSVSLDNLKTATEYHYKVTAKGKSGETQSVSGSFQTAKSNRFISLPGITNTRDIGGYTVSGGKRVKQGLLIRGTELDGLVKNDYYLTNPKDAEPFGFVYDLDLRSSSIFNASYVSRLGKKVTHKFYDATAYGGVFAKEHKESLKQIFTDMANPNNYPMYLHCTHGSDRTGTVVSLLLGLLGVSETDLRTEYSLSGFMNLTYANDKALNPVFAGLEGFPGKTLQEKTEQYFISSLGISRQQVQNIRSIFLENAN